MVRRDAEARPSRGSAASLAPPQGLALDHDGFVIERGALDVAAITALLEAFAAAAPEGGTQHVDIDDDTPAAAVWRGLGRHPFVLAAAAHVLGRGAVVRGLHGRNPLPGFGQQGLHADWKPLAPGEPFVVATAIFMLDAFTPLNGATRVVPGSHRITASLPKTLAQPLAHHRDEIVVAGEAGSVLVMNGHLWHSGTANRSAGPRRAAQVLLVAAD